MLPGISFHPACVILVALTNLRTETLRHGGGARDSLSRESPTSSLNHHQTPSKLNEVVPPSIILNVCGRVIMIQGENAKSEGGRDSPQMVISLD